MYRSMVFLMIALCGVVLATTCSKCDFMKSGSQLSGFRLCEETCDANLCYIVVNLHQNETLIAGCLDANDHDIALFMNQSLCYRRTKYTVCGCSKTNRCNSPMTSSKIFNFVEKPILEDYILFPESNDDTSDYETSEADDLTSSTSSSNHEMETNIENEKSAVDEGIRLPVSEVSEPSVDELHNTMTVQEAHREPSVVAEKPYLNSYNPLPTNTANVGIDEQFNGEEKSVAQTNAESFGSLLDPFKMNGNRSTRMKIYSMKAIKDDKLLAAIFNKSKSLAARSRWNDSDNSNESFFDNDDDGNDAGISDDNEEIFIASPADGGKIRSKNFHRKNANANIVNEPNERTNTANTLNNNGVFLLLFIVILYDWNSFHI